MMTNNTRAIEALNAELALYAPDCGEHAGLEIAVGVLRLQDTESSNSYYKFINERFDKRCAELSSLGFFQRYYEIEGIRLSAFVMVKFGKPRIVSTGVILYAEERAWNDCLTNCREYVNL